MKKYIFILLTSFALTSCVDLLQEPQSKLTPATIELTEQTLENMANGNLNSNEGCRGSLRRIIPEKFPTVQKN